MITEVIFHQNVIKLRKNEKKSIFFHFFAENRLTIDFF